jgi:hypothetical protein
LDVFLHRYLERDDQRGLDQGILDTSALNVPFWLGVFENGHDRSNGGGSSGTYRSRAWLSVWQNDPIIAMTVHPTKSPTGALARSSVPTASRLEPWALDLPSEFVVLSMKVLQLVRHGDGGGACGSEHPPGGVHVRIQRLLPGVEDSESSGQHGGRAAEQRRFGGNGLFRTRGTCMVQHCDLAFTKALWTSHVPPLASDRAHGEPSGDIGGAESQGDAWHRLTDELAPNGIAAAFIGFC